MTRRGRVTSADVAREAGVSRTTVSYVLNEDSRRGISEATAQRVREVAARLGYLPSAAARSLRRGRSELVLVAIGDWPMSYAVSETVEHLTRALTYRGLAVLVHHRTPESRPITELCWTVDAAAVIALEGVSDREEETLQAAGIHVTHPRTGERSDDPDILVAASPELGRLQVEHLAAAGHRRVGYALPDDPRLSVGSTVSAPPASGSAWPRPATSKCRSIPAAPPLPSPASCPPTSRSPPSAPTTTTSRSPSSPGSARTT
jgi:DNA-binding LacI/PurR family transcriptional regulator